MTDYAGGIRNRLIYDSVFYTVQSCLDELGWFTPADWRKDVQMVPDPVDFKHPLEPNVIAIYDSDILDSDGELGSNLADITWTMYVDVFAESRSVGLHIVNDVRDILRGRILGRTTATIPVLDYSLATPVQIFYVDIENVLIDKPENPSEIWLKDWYTCRFDIIDSYLGI